jgi:hypothetical protein
MFRLIAASLLILVACSPRPVASPEGLWAWNERWDSAPVEIVKEFGPQWTSPGIALRFCPDGRFRMATGVFYRRPAYVTLGSSDGLSLYEGKWSRDANGITVRYRLVDVEIRFAGVENEMRKEIVEHPRVDGDSLLFTYHQPSTGRAYPFRFRRGNALPAKLSGRFVECSNGS